MKNLNKKIVAFAATTAIAVTSLTGCGGFKSSDVVATVGESKITADVANFYARFQQAAVETSYAQMLGENMWEQQVAEGTTYEDSVKGGVMDSLQQLYILEAHMDEYKVSLTDEEKSKISKAAADFEENNNLKAKKLISGDKEVVERVLTLITIQNKMMKEMTKDVDTNVSDEEAAQKGMQYVKFALTTTDAEGNSQALSEEEKAALKNTAANFLTGAKEAADFKAYAADAGYEATETTFDKDSTSPAKELIAAADTLAEGAFTEVIETSDALYVAKVTSLLDRKATDTKKESIVSARKDEKFNKIFEGWKKDTKIKVDKDVWKKIDFKKVGVKVKQEEK